MPHMKNLIWSSGVQTTYVPFKGTGDMTTVRARRACHRGDVVFGPLPSTTRARFARWRSRWTSVTRLLPDVPTFKELGFDWIDGAYRGIGMPKSTTPDARKRMFGPVGCAQQ